MASAIDPTKPADGVAADKADLRANLLAAKTEIEALQNASGSDAAPSQIASSGATFLLPIVGRMHTNAEVLSQANNDDFEVPANAPAGSKWLIYPLHTGCTVSTVGNVGSVNNVAGGAARLIMNGLVVAEVRSNPGSAPVVAVRGSVILAPIVVSASKTYTNDDSNAKYRIATTGNQIFGEAATYADGFEAVLIRESAGTITIQGATTNYTINGPDIVIVTKSGSALLASGKAGVVILDPS